ncbi:MAG TPA: glycoside hydrolase family 2 protein, partial [Armatimonadota bacterium]|nr:glycoside hydrolase family 2 protein [Armatimonadota bacterium]
MINRLTLDGTWELAGFDEGTGDWAWPEDRYPIPAKVPGEVHPALMAAGLIPDPYYGDNASRASWVEEKEWWYRRRFRLPEGFLHPRAFLEFDGLDTFATVLLNSRQVGESRNMFIPYRFDVTGMLREEGENVLEVRFASTARVAGRMDLDDLEVLYRRDRAGVRK